MTWDRRSFIAAAGAVIPSAMLSSCARAQEGGWPGPDTPAGQLPRLPIGMNLAGITDWEPGFPFQNLMWGARAWMSRNAVPGGPWDTEQAAAFAYDADGYPLEVPFVTPGSKGMPQQIFTLLPNRLTAGRYVLLHDGEGAFEGLLGAQVLSQQAGRVVLHLAHNPREVQGLVITHSKRGNHVRNIRIIPEKVDPATLAANPFRDDFLDFCRPFHVLRFMDWGAINGSMEEEWANRRRPGFYSMVGGAGDLDGQWGPPPTPFQRMHAGGVAFEHMLALANLLQIDPWICIPHRASDDYIRQLSALVREKLDPARRVYVEYSNELWNWQFDQAQWELKSELAGKLVEQKGETAWEMKDGKRSGTNHPERIGALFTRAYRLWLENWQGPDRKRVTTVCAIQAGWPDAAIRTMEWCAADKSIDVVSGAAYFAPDDKAYAEWESRSKALTAAEVARTMQRVLAEQGRADSDQSQIARRARALGLGYVNYEGGQHLQPRGQEDAPYLPALGAVQSDPAMYDLYVENLRQQRRLGSSLMCAFNSVSDQGTRWGSWGAKPSYATPDDRSPKYKALIACNTPRQS